FGNTLYSVSSVISTVLAALSLGYYLGGYLADRQPSFRWFWGLIFASGLSLFGVHLLILLALPSLGEHLSVTSGPLIASLLLFFIPGLLLGTLSPFVIRLLSPADAQAVAGQTAGAVFFWSTFGSIVGSLLAGFILIPHFGALQIIAAVAAMLSAMGLIGLSVCLTKKKALIPGILALLLLSSSGYALEQVKIGKSKALVDRDGVYERIHIYDGNFGGTPARFFEHDRSHSSAMYLPRKIETETRPQSGVSREADTSLDSDELVYEYTKSYRLYRLFKPELNKALVIGGGAYSVPKALLQESPTVEVDVAETEPELFELAQQFFRLPADPRLRNFVEDGRRFLRQTDRQYDLIFSDVYYSQYSIPQHFTSREFFEEARQALTPGGIFIANVVGSLSRQRPSFTWSEVRTFRSAFPNSFFLALNSPASMAAQNIILVGLNSDSPSDLSSDEFLSDSDPFIRGLSNKTIDLARFDLDDHPLFTDDYSPAEYFTAALLKRSFAKEMSIFDGEEAFALLEQLVEFGPRHLSAPGHRRAQEFLLAELKGMGLQVRSQEWTHRAADGKDYPLMNIVGRLYPENPRRIILEAHYVSWARSPNGSGPSPGANDNGSGVAVALEVARHFVESHQPLPFGIDVVFMDGEAGEEDQTLTEWEPIGANYMVKNLGKLYPDKRPEAMIALDLVGDRDLNIHPDKASLTAAPELVVDFWKKAQMIAPKQFPTNPKYSIRADHTPFNAIGIPSVLLIDYDYPAIHTAADRLENCSAESLEATGKTVISYLRSLP
ncbi:MAG: fused MFS/spermidine synthase, partial [bacterium]|nr:fused MFS/spermidine synthase [bacterium]